MDTIIWYISGTYSCGVKGYRASCTISSCSLTHRSVPLVSWVRHLFVYGSNQVRGELMALHICQIQQYDYHHCEQQFEKQCGKGDTPYNNSWHCFFSFHLICLTQLSSPTG